MKTFVRIVFDKQEYENYFKHKLNFLSEYVDAIINYHDEVIVEFKGADVKTLSIIFEQLLLQ